MCCCDIFIVIHHAKVGLFYRNCDKGSLQNIDGIRDLRVHYRYDKYDHVRLPATLIDLIKITQFLWEILNVTQMMHY